MLFTDNDRYGNGDRIAEKLKELGFVKEGFETPYTPNTFEVYSEGNRKNIKVWCFILNKDVIKKYFQDNPINRPIVKSYASPF